MFSCAYSENVEFGQLYLCLLLKVPHIYGKICLKGLKELVMVTGKQLSSDMVDKVLVMSIELSRFHVGLMQHA